MVPAVRLQATCGLDAQGIIQPAHRQVHLHLAGLQHYAIASRPSRVLHPRQDHPALLILGINPGCKGEFVVEAKVADIAGFDEALAIEDSGLANSSWCKSGIGALELA